MKKRMNLGLVIFLMLTSLLFGQDRIGLIGGINKASMKLQPNSEYPTSNYSGLAVGFFRDRELGSDAWLNYSTMYVEKGMTEIEKLPMKLFIHTSPRLLAYMPGILQSTRQPKLHILETRLCRLPVCRQSRDTVVNQV